ncbi:MAG: NADase-type glycan-binding domain-containing protein, partial [Acidimicrobiia bacterium]
STPGPSAPKAAPPPKPAARPAPAAPAAREPQPDDRICAECGAGNASQRKFCRGCGTSLVEAPAPVAKEEKPPPKLVDKVIGKKEPGPMAAGERPPPKKSKANLTKPLMAGGIVVVGALAFLFKGGGVPSKTEFTPVNPTAAAASTELPDHPAAHAIDTGSNTFWAEADPGDGTGQTLTVNFANPFRVGKVGVFPGRDGEGFLAQPRPQDIHIELLDAGGASVGGADATLEDIADLQQIDVSGEGVSAVRIEIRSVYAGQSGTEASITDLQFFTAS